MAELPDPELKYEYSTNEQCSDRKEKEIATSSIGDSDKKVKKRKKEERKRKKQRKRRDKSKTAAKGRWQ
ncbi:Hypothetical predicted protein [Paramuricea clavata]|uniref:Uncharacterized protein n=1 Tax=Paramuricea clavata TaxID=317549 RepID=A0A6S7HEX3_PARCT|nr:Hypothetical predicted protein [Paramuricea clavata]